MAISAIKIRGVGKRYGLHRALKGVDLELRNGVCALLGANGAGKSTLLGILSTLVRPTQGEVVYESPSGAAASGPELRRHIGVLAHDSFLYGGLSAIENLRFWGKLYGVAELAERALKLLRQVGLDEGAWERPCSTYSRGMAQRLALARTLLHEPSVLLLDEPFTGLDRGGAEALATTLRHSVEQGTVVLVVTHDLESIGDITSHVVILKKGHVAFEGREPAYGYRELRELYHRHSE